LDESWTTASVLQISCYIVDNMVYWV
jgi:hypothetical protein